MEKSKSQILCIFLLLFLLSTVAIPVAAVTISVVDEAYLKANDYIITDQSGAPVANFTGSFTATLPAGKSYSVNLRPNGLFDFSKEAPGDFTSLETIFVFFRQNLAGLVVLAGIIGIVLLWRH